MLKRGSLLQHNLGNRIIEVPPCFPCRHKLLHNLAGGALPQHHHQPGAAHRHLLLGVAACSVTNLSCIELSVIVTTNRVVLPLLTVNFDKILTVVSAELLLYLARLPCEQVNKVNNAGSTNTVQYFPPAGPNEWASSGREAHLTSHI